MQYDLLNINHKRRARFIGVRSIEHKERNAFYGTKGILNIKRHAVRNTAVQNGLIHRVLCGISSWEQAYVVCTEY